MKLPTFITRLFTSKTHQTYILVHIFRANVFEGQYVQKVDNNIDSVAGTIVRLDPRTERNINILHLFERSKGLRVSRPSLKEGYTSDVEMRVVQIFQI